MARTSKKKGWHPADIVAAVRKRGQTLTGISTDLGLTSSAGSRALLFPHARVNRAIADVIGKPIHEIWPQWFGADGERIAGRMSSRSPEDNPTKADRESRGAPSSSTQKAA